MAVERDQLERLAQMNLSTVPSGCDIPLDLFAKYILTQKYNYALLEFGFGTGLKALKITNAFHFPVLGADINVSNPHPLPHDGFFPKKADVRHAELFHDYASALFEIEMYAGAYMEGVLCNQHKNDWQPILESAYIHTQPDGYVLIADVFAMNDPNDLLAHSFRNREKYQKSVDRWQNRYETNQKAAKILGIEIAATQFMVAKPGKQKHMLDWGNVDTLIELYNSDQFERWAQHIPYMQVINYLENFAGGLTIVEDIPAVFKSRTHEPLNGRIIVAHKRDTIYRLDPILAGIDVYDEAAIAQAHAEFGSIATNADVWCERLGKNLPNADYHFPFLHEMRDRLEGKVSE